MKKATNNNNIDQRVLDEIIKSVQQIDYGEVVVKIHNSEIVQIEKKIKKRFNRLHE